MIPENGSLTVQDVYVPLEFERQIPIFGYAVVEVNEKGIVIEMMPLFFQDWDETAEVAFNAYRAKLSMNGAIVQRKIGYCEVKSVGFLN